jgi:hypothetical protein
VHITDDVLYKRSETAGRPDSTGATPDKSDYRTSGFWPDFHFSGKRVNRALAICWRNLLPELRLNHSNAEAEILGLPQLPSDPFARSREYAADPA